MEQYYKFIFADGTVTVTKGLNKNELAWEEQQHGKLVNKIPL